MSLSETDSLLYHMSARDWKVGNWLHPHPIGWILATSPSKAKAKMIEPYMFAHLKEKDRDMHGLLLGSIP